LTSGSATTTFTARAAASAFGPRWAQFFAGQFAVAVLVQLFQRDGGVGNFLFVDDAIGVRVERLHEGHDETRATRATRASGTAFARRAIGSILREANRANANETGD
jgi:hypothetical protein